MMMEFWWVFPVAIAFSAIAIASGVSGALVAHHIPGGILKIIFGLVGQPIPDWELLHPVDIETFTDIRIQAHWAARIVGAVGEALVPRVPDDSHTSLTWLEGPAILGGAAVQAGSRAVYAAIHIGRMELLLLDADMNTLQVLTLDQRSVAEAAAWLAGVIDEAGYHEGTGDLPLFTRDIPDHPVGSGGPFSHRSEREYQDLQNWFGNSSRLLTAFSGSLDSSGISPIRCWPHHFDIAALLSLDRDADPEKTRSIGMGMTPGDGSYAVPYFYVTLWPYPDAPDLPDLTEGHWHTEGWVGAVLTAEALTRYTDEEEQSRVAWTFLDEAVSATRRLLQDPA